MMGLTSQCSSDQPFNGKFAFQMTLHMKMRSWVCVFAFSKSFFIQFLNVGPFTPTVKGPLGSIFRSVWGLHLILKESWMLICCIGICPPTTILSTRNKGHFFGSFIWHESCICIQVCSHKLCSYLCFPNFPVKLPEFAGCSIADVHIGSH